MKIFILKFLLAAALIYWIFDSGKMDLSILWESRNHLLEWGICLSIVVINTLMVAYRWKRILEVQSQIRFKYISIVKVTWIGNLFNTVLPGLVSGDFIKLFYAKKLDPSLSKTFLVTSVFLDRILGLFGLLMVLGIATIYNYQSLMMISPQIRHLIHINGLIFLGMLSILLTLFFPTFLQNYLLKMGEKIPYLGHLVARTLTQFWAVGKDWKNVLFIVFFSMLSQTLNMLAFWTLITPFIEYASNATVSLTLLEGLSFIPLGFVVTAIPITPSGIGVGHAAFDLLFRYYGVINGASLFNFNLIANIGINLLGVIPYLSNKHSYSEEEMENFKKETFSH